MAYKLSILIPTLESRSGQFNLLSQHLINQKNQFPKGVIQILALKDNGEKTIGEKRNILMHQAKGDYISFIDDDDWVDDNYIKCLMLAINHNPDCCSLIGEYFVDGKFDRRFYHSIKYSSWHEDAFGYYRMPNHLNCLRTDKVKWFTFPELNHGEDSDWSKKIFDAGVLQNEIEIPVPIYSYLYKTNK